MNSTNTNITPISYGFCFKPPVGCFGYATILAINDEGKKILFDTGSYSLRSVLVEYLKNNFVDYVVVSHLHFDHSSNLDLFINSNTKIVISRQELEYYDEFKGKDNDLLACFDMFKNKLNLMIIDKDFSLTQNCKIVFTPGHTKGHISLEVTCKNKTYFLCGDCIKTTKEIKKFTTNTNAYDIKLAKTTREKILKKYTLLFPGHDVFWGNRNKLKKIKLRRF